MFYITKIYTDDFDKRWRESASRNNDFGGLMFLFCVITYKYS